MCAPFVEIQQKAGTRTLLLAMEKRTGRSWMPLHLHQFPFGFNFGRLTCSSASLLNPNLQPVAGTIWHMDFGRALKKPGSLAARSYGQQTTQHKSPTLFWCAAFRKQNKKHYQLSSGLLFREKHQFRAHYVTHIGKKKTKSKQEVSTIPSSTQRAFPRRRLGVLLPSLLPLLPGALLLPVLPQLIPWESHSGQIWTWQGYLPFPFFPGIRIFLENLRKPRENGTCFGKNDG